MSDWLLDVQGVSVRYGTTAVLSNVDLQVRPGEVVGLVGESGSGKSTLVGAIMRTLPDPARITSGRVTLAGKDVFALPDDEVRGMRWRDVAIVPQSALDALNPVLTVRQQLVDTLKAHRPDWDTARCDTRALQALLDVGISGEHYHAYPHTLSGGTRQRVAIALAMLLEPPLLIMDEPTTALDVVVQGRILSRLLELQRTRDFAILFVTHDLPMLLKFADRLVVLYAGQVAEEGSTAELRDDPHHPYTHGLLSALNPLEGPRDALFSIPGVPPDPANPPSGCRFHPRCHAAVERCSFDVPVLRTRQRRRVACHRAGDFR